MSKFHHQSILIDLSTGMTAKEVAQKHGMSLPNVLRIRAGLKESIKAEAVLPHPHPQTPIVNVLASQIEQPPQYFDLLRQAKAGIEAGVIFLTKVVHHLDPEKASIPQVRMVSECVVETLADVVTAWRAIDVAGCVDPREAGDSRES